LAAQAGGALECFVSIEPQAYFVNRIAEDRVTVHVMVGPGQSPATYEPSPKQLARLAASRAYFSIGAPFEASLLGRVQRNFKDVEIIDTRAGITPISTEGNGGKGHVHHDAVLDPHVWLSPGLAKTVAVNIRDALARMMPSSSDVLRVNCDALTAELDALDAEIAAMLANHAGKAFYVFHPSYGYFAREYGLEQVAVEINGAAPGPRHLAEIIERAKADGVSTLFVQPQFSRKSAETIAAATGAAVVELDPLAYDYMENLRDIARKIAVSLGGRPDPGGGEGRGGEAPRGEVWPAGGSPQGDARSGEAKPASAPQ
jgi:zinc transport system substrate-binding protein